MLNPSFRAMESVICSLFLAKDGKNLFIGARMAAGAVDSNLKHSKHKKMEDPFVFDSNDDSIDHHYHLITMKKANRFALSIATLGYLTAASLIVHAPPAARGQDSGVSSAEELKRSLTPTAPPAAATRGLTRGLTRGAPAPAAPVTRSGRAPAGGGTRGTRALVDVDLEVAAQANVSLSNIQFELNSTEYADATSRQQVAELIAALKDLAKEGRKFLVEGHTCPKGDSEHNTKLSYDRAERVRQDLIAGNVPESALRAIGCGESEAAKENVTENTDEARLSPYRKVMIHVLAE